MTRIKEYIENIMGKNGWKYCIESKNCKSTSPLHLDKHVVYEYI